MRHAQGADPWTIKDSSPRPELSHDGYREARAVANRLAETIRGGLTTKLGDIVIVHPPDGPAAATAVIVGEAISAEFAGKDSVPAPVDTQPSEQLEAGKLKVQPGAVTALVPKDRSLEVLVVVGHDPEMGHQVHEELGSAQPMIRKRLAHRVPLRRCEAAMINLTESPRSLDWVISPASGKLITELQGKVKSKMDTAKVFGAFLTAFTGLAVRELVATERSAPYTVIGGVGVAFLAFAVLCYMITMFLYDSLLMPTDQWPSYRESDNPSMPTKAARWASTWFGTGQSPSRPPSSAATVIFHSMQRVWSGLFVPATGTAGVGIALVVMALAQPTREWILAPIIALIVVPTAALVLAAVARPRFGSND